MKSKHLFFFIILFAIHSGGTSQGWTAAELDKANTANNIYSLTTQEKEVIKYINLARLYPQKFASIEVKDYLGPSKYGNYLETSTYKKSLMATLQYKQPVNVLYFDESMYILAACFAKESGATGKVGHSRTSCFNGYDAECCSYGHDQGKDIALQLLIDHDVPSLGHREICLNGEYDKIGVNITQHKLHQYCSVLDFKRRTYQADNNRLIENYTQKTTEYYVPNIGGELSNTIKQKSNSTSNPHKLVSIKMGASAFFLVDEFDKLTASHIDQMSYQLNAMIGFNLGKSTKNTSLGVFGSLGRYNPVISTLNSNNILNSENSFLELEGGLLIKELFRVSGGMGYAFSRSTDLSSHNYSTVSAGFSLGPNWLKIDLINTFIIPKNNQKILFRPAVGLSIVLNVINKK